MSVISELEAGKRVIVVARCSSQVPASPRNALGRVAGCASGEPVSWNAVLDRAASHPTLDVTSHGHGRASVNFQPLVHAFPL
jgi:hypothetical protein